MGDQLKPMLAELAPAPFDSDNFIFEPKWDGARCFLHVNGDEIILEGRRGTTYTHRFPEITRSDVLIKEGCQDSAILDCEIICGDGSLKSFQKLQTRIHKEQKLQIRYASMENPATLMVFDVLEYRNLPVISEPLWKRKLLLETLLDSSERVQHTPYREKDGIFFLEEYLGEGFEGVMAKSRDSLYYAYGDENARRRSEWLKVKVPKKAKLLAVGMTNGTGTRAGTFGALVLAEMKDGQLIHRGEVGSGFSNRQLKEIREITSEYGGDFARDNLCFQGLKGIRWIKPIEVRVKYLDETEDGKLRHPVFKGMIQDDLFSMLEGGE
jgi:DNA ligase-1